MPKVVLAILPVLILAFSSCRKDTGIYLPKPPDSRGQWFEPVPYGMAYVPRSSYRIGPNDPSQVDNTTPSKIVTIESFWMDDTEISNNEYRQFVFWVRDSIARKMLGEVYADYLISEDSRGVPLSETRINWEEPINWKDPDIRSALEELYVPEAERIGFQKEVDSRKLIYDYYWIDYEQAARRKNSFNFETQKYDGTVIDENGQEKPIENRRSFLMHESVPIYPDTLCWIRDYTYSYNEPLAREYFGHRAFDDYPVVGVTWKQAEAFCDWRTKLYSNFSTKQNETPPHDFRLPTEAEWEVAARGGLDNAVYPWGSYYTRNDHGCFVANFKPLRGNYVADSPGNVTTMKVGTFDPNPLGLYDMAGNVAEWTSDAFYESAYDVISDFNPTVRYNAAPGDPPVLKRKVIRGGSWKDMAYFIRTGTRSFEYQDSSKSYIGFRCVRTSFRNELYNR